ncbi:MAG: TolC family protein [Alphaproteobacteria bacterium]|nr:TolC family protein [Alphaproteobacteria bacterium]
MTDTAILAVLRNPDLKAARRKRDVAAAEAFAAGLLPDPQLSANLDHPTTAGYMNGYGAGLTLDLRSFFTHATAKAIARDRQASLNMDILWQEWQTIQQARSLYAEKYFAMEKLRLLQNTVNLYAIQSKHAQKALKAGDATLDQAGSALVALMDARGGRDTQQRALLDINHKLDALLDLSSDTDVPLRSLGNPAMPTDDDVYAALALLPQRRPDLIALQTAYASQEETLYKAVLEQFPDISVGFNAARDTSGVHSIGPAVSLNLPVFNGSRGQIAVAKATRAELRQEYQARLDQAHSDALTLWRQTQLIARQIKAVQKSIPQLQSLAASAGHAYNAGDFPAQTYVAVESGLLKKKMEYLGLQQALWTNRIALDALLAWPPDFIAARNQERMDFKHAH